MLTAEPQVDNGDFPDEDDESCCEGYSEALKSCHVLAVDLLQKAINNVDVKRCWDCSSWVGRCLKGNAWRIAIDKACGDFSEKRSQPCNEGR